MSDSCHRDWASWNVSPEQTRTLRRQRLGRERWGWRWGVVVGPFFFLMTLTVKVCRATSATVIRGPASHTGRKPTPLPFRWVQKGKRFSFEEITETFRSQRVWLLGKNPHFWWKWTTSINRRGFCIKSLEYYIHWIQQAVSVGFKSRHSGFDVKHCCKRSVWRTKIKQMMSLNSRKKQTNETSFRLLRKVISYVNDRCLSEYQPDDRQPSPCGWHSAACLKPQKGETNLFHESSLFYLTPRTLPNRSGIQFVRKVVCSCCPATKLCVFCVSILSLSCPHIITHHLSAPCLQRQKVIWGPKKMCHKVIGERLVNVSKTLCCRSATVHSGWKCRDMKRSSHLESVQCRPVDKCWGEKSMMIYLRLV